MVIFLNRKVCSLELEKTIAMYFWLVTLNRRKTLEVSEWVLEIESCLQVLTSSLRLYIDPFACSIHPISMKFEWGLQYHPFLYSLRPKLIVLPPGFFGPKIIVPFICLARNLRLKVKYLRAKLSVSRSLLTPQLQGAFWSSFCFLF